MPRLSAAKSRLGNSQPRLHPSAEPERKGVRRSDGPINTARWQKLRWKILKRDDWYCQQTGVKLRGKHPAPNSPVVDHIVPHRGDLDLFWDEDNLQSVSKEYHDRVKQSIEKRGGSDLPAPKPRR